MFILFVLYNSASRITDGELRAGSCGVFFDRGGCRRAAWLLFEKTSRVAPVLAAAGNCEAGVLVVGGGQSAAGRPAPSVVLDYPRY